jgi:8-amino-7-oxononanoate synthase
MRPPLYDRLQQSLDDRKHNGLLRAVPGPLPPHHHLIDFSTNSYCALHDNNTVNDAAKRLAHGSLSGNLASRLIAETSPLARSLEDELAAWEGTECALIFNSGYAANTGILQALCGRDTEVFCDRLNHASIIDGVLLAGAKLNRYRHVDMADLRERLASSSAKEKIIVTDSVFSMDGDRAPLADICELAASHQCFVMVDEAHATGIFGASGSGIVEALGVADAVDVRIGTLSKAVAGCGGFFAGSRLLRDFFVNNARSLIYSTALPHAVIAWDLASVCYLRAHPELGSRLMLKAQEFRSRLRELGYDTMFSTTQIVPCMAGDESAAVGLSAFLRERGIIAPAIRPPTVPKGSSRIRFSVHLGLSIDDETKVYAALKEWKISHG